MSHENGNQKILTMRPMSLDPDLLDVEGFTIKGVTIATDQVIGTEDGEERLVISEESLDLDVFRTTGLNLLMNHEANGINMGKVINPQIVNGKLKGDLVFDESVPEAVDVFGAIMRGLAKDLSVGGYRNESTSTRMGKSLGQSVVVTSWEPFDVSFVGLAADPNCGLYRSSKQKPVNDKKSEGGETALLPNDNLSTMKDETKAPEVKIEKNEIQTKPESTAIERAATQKPAEVKPVETPSNASEIKRASGLLKLKKAHDLTDDTYLGWLENGYTVDQAKIAICDSKIERASKQVPIHAAHDSVVRPANPYTDGKATLTLRSGIGALAKIQAGQAHNFTADEDLANEVSKDFQHGEEGGPGFRIPYAAGVIKRAFQGLGANAGANFTTTQVNMTDLAKYLYENTVTQQLNIKTRTGAQNLVSIPIVDAIGEANYGTEAAPGATEQETTTKNLLLSPKPVIGLKRRTNLAQILNPGIQQELEEELMMMVRIAIDKAILIGKPNGPAGIAGVAATDKSAGLPTTKFLEMEAIRDQMKNIRAANVGGPISIVTDPEISNRWANQTVGSKTGNNQNKALLWTTNADASTVLARPGAVSGAPVYDSTNIRTTTASDNYRAIVGAFQYCYSYFWGQTMKLDIRESGNDFDNERVSIKLVAYHDSGIVYPEAFATYKGVKVTS